MTSDRPILYCGDTSLSGAAGYLAGLLSLWKFGFDYVPSDVPMSDALLGAGRKLFIVSDYPSRLFDRTLQTKLVEQVRRGAGLLMIGGWESYCGHGGDWAGTPVAEALPVEISTSDDRINCDQPALLVKTQEHPIVSNLMFASRPPTVGGFNSIKPKAGSSTIVDVQRFAVTASAAGFDWRPTERHPMLVVGKCGEGNVAALATDLAPHWVGGLVDWGPGRVTAEAPGSWQIEVGSEYAAFIRNLVTWTGNL
jgi:uncharacterized membrane protein